MTLEESLEYLNDDEFCEVTPESIRLRKRFLIRANVKELLRKEICRSVK